jgi:hypothetical protein
MIRLLFELAKKHVAMCVLDFVPVVLDQVQTKPSKGLYVGTAGNITITTASGKTQTIPSVAGGMVHPISAICIKTSGTTAEGIFFTY